MRSLFRGEGRRYDVKRRVVHCLCFITTSTNFALFRLLLLQIHSVALLETKAGACKQFCEVLYNMRINSNDNCSIPRSVLSFLQNDMQVRLHHAGSNYLAYDTTSFTTLLDVLGIDKFLFLLSAVLSESRVIFVSDSTEKLLTAVPTSMHMIYPFKWQHLFIPVLAYKSIKTITLPTPYIIGIKRNISAQMYKESIGDAIVIDLDNGNLNVTGTCKFKNFVGDSGSSLKQVSESFDTFKARAYGVANLVLGKSSNDSSNDIAPKDVVASMVSDLRHILASKPGTHSIQSMTSGLLRTIPGLDKSTSEELKLKWTLDSEKAIRETLLVFYVYVFAELDQLIKKKVPASASSSTGSKGTKQLPKGVNSSSTSSADCDRNMFDLKSFAARRAQMGDTDSLQEFLSGFIHTKMFSTFCTSRLKATTTKATKDTTITGTSAGDIHCDEYDLVCMDMKSNRLPINLGNVKQSVTNRTNQGIEVIKGYLGSEYNSAVIAMTSASNATKKSTLSYDTLMHDDVDERSTHYHSVRKICIDANSSDELIRIMRTIAVRLHSINACGCRGAGSCSTAYQTVSLLKYLLVHGPECVVSYALDFVGVLRSIHAFACASASSDKHLVSSSSSISISSISMISSSGSSSGNDGIDVDVSVISTVALSAIELIVDHKKLMLQRRRARMIADGIIVVHKQDKIDKKDIFVNSGYGNKSFPAFEVVHKIFSPIASSPSCTVPVFNATSLRLTVPVAIDADAEDDDDDDDDKQSQLIGLSKKPPQQQQQRQASTPTLNISTAVAVAPARSSKSGSVSQIPSPSVEPSLMDDDDANAKYRIINQHTREVYDLRELDKISIDAATGWSNKPSIPLLSPPPPVKPHKHNSSNSGSSSSSSGTSSGGSGKAKESLASSKSKANAPPPVDPFASFTSNAAPKAIAQAPVLPTKPSASTSSSSSTLDLFKDFTAPPVTTVNHINSYKPTAGSASTAPVDPFSSLQSKQPHVKATKDPFADLINLHVQR